MWTKTANSKPLNNDNPLTIEIVYRHEQPTSLAIFKCFGYIDGSFQIILHAKTPEAYTGLISNIIAKGYSSANIGDCDKGEFRCFATTAESFQKIILAIKAVCSDFEKIEDQIFTFAGITPKKTYTEQSFFRKRNGSSSSSNSSSSHTDPYDPSEKYRSHCPFDTN